MDAFFFEKLHHAFDIRNTHLDQDSFELSDELLFISYQNKEEYWTRYNILFSSLLQNPFNIDSVLEVSRMASKKGKRDAIINYLLDYCNRNYDVDCDGYESIESKPYLRVLHQKALYVVDVYLLIRLRLDCMEGYCNFLG